MKNVLLAISIALASSIVNAQSCPDTSSVYRSEGGIIKPYAPPGWMLANRVDRLHSTDIHFKYAAWDSNRIDPRDENRVMCIYAYPDFPNFFILETINIIDRHLVESHAEWKAYGTTYLRCTEPSPSGCLFG